MIWHQLNKQLLSSKSGLFQLLNGLEYGQSEIFEQRFGQISTTRYRQRIITDFSTLQKQKNRKIRYYRPFMKVWFFVHYYELNDIRPAGKEKYKMYSTIELQSQFTICSKQYKQRSTLDMVSEADIACDKKCGQPCPPDPEDSNDVTSDDSQPENTDF